jgi:hypothetical protein
VIPSFELDGARFVRPDYVGGGLANLAPTVISLLAPSASNGLPPFSEALLPKRLTEGVRNVVVVIADGLGHNQLQREIAAGNAPRLAELLARATAGNSELHYGPMTSVFPTTTVAALGSVNSGVLPVQHGLLAYTIYLPEFSMVAEMIRWGPLNRRMSFTDPEFGGAPEQFFWAPTIYHRLQQAGIQRTFAVNPTGFSGTALTRMLHQRADYRGYIATSSLAPIVLRLLNETRDTREPTYIYAYWPTVDTIAHVIGPMTPEHGAEVAAFDAAFGRLVERLPRGSDTLLLLSADHGHVDVAPSDEVSLDEHRELLAMLRVPPAGERRAVYLHAREGALDDVCSYARERLHDVAVSLTREQAVAEGLFGPTPLPDRAAQRIGDLLLFPRDNRQIVATIEPPEGLPKLPPPPNFRGLHGGLTEDEAIVPLLAVRV